MESNHDQVDYFNSDERDNHASESPDQQILAQKRVCSQRPVTDSFKRDRDKKWNNQRVENNRRKDC